MTRLLCAVLAVVLAGVAGVDDSPAEQKLVKELFAKNKEAIELLDGIKDKAAAEKAKPKLEELAKQIQTAMAELKKRPKPDVAAAFDAQKEKPASLVDAYDRLAGRSAPAAEVFADIPFIKEQVEAKEALAKLNAEILIKACKTYYTQNLEWPKKLTDVAALLEEGEKATIDPWGKPYKYEIGRYRTKGVDGKDVDVERPYVWSERKVGDKTKVFGLKPPKKT
jgi:hypothetical protein